MAAILYLMLLLKAGFRTCEPGAVVETQAQPVQTSNKEFRLDEEFGLEHYHPSSPRSTRSVIDAPNNFERVIY